MDFGNVAARLVAALDLDIPPIGLAFAAASPAGVETFVGEVPSACTFWRRAETQSFYAPAEKHFNCPIGAMVMGFQLPEHVQTDLMSAVTMMCDTGYITMDEAARIPTVPGQAAGIVYGPLAQFPGTPELVVFWLTPRQAMLFNEATGTSRWTADRPAVVSGRPACAALPMALAGGHSSLSMGCMGMRTFTEVAEDRMLATLPAGDAAALIETLEAIGAANATMRAHYEQKKVAFTSS